MCLCFIDLVTGFCESSFVVVSASGVSQTISMAAAGSGLDRLTCHHAIKLSPAVSCSVEECGLAV